MSRGVVAVTGATGFLGRHLVRALAADGWSVRILARRDVVCEEWVGIEPEVVIGGLSSARAVARLCDAAEAVVHVAGLIKAANRAAFDKVNVDGSFAVAKAAKAAGARLIVVSSLAAREPSLSDYAASKRAGEDAAREAFGESLAIVRPPAIYGPGDLETLALFRAARRSPVLPVLDARARISLIHAEDAAARIAGLVAAPIPGVFALSDARTDGYSWTELMESAAKSVGRRPYLLRISPLAIKALAGFSERLAIATGDISIFTSGKAREMLHLDWSLTPSEVLPGPIALRYGIDDGFAHSVKWYRAKGYLVAA